MVHDVLPEILADVQAEFERQYGKSEVVKQAFASLKLQKASYETVNDFAIEVGQILSEALSGSVTGARLPDGKMYYNIAQRLLTDVLGRNHELVSGYASDVQKQLNDSAGIGLKVQVPDFNQDRLSGIVNRLDSEAVFDNVAWILKEPIVNFTQSIVDDSIKANAEFQYKAGMEPEIIRTEGGKCCDWCREVVGTYRYPRVPKDVYRRHQRCRCKVEYDPKAGKVRDVWSKIWRKKEESSKIEERKNINLEKSMSNARKNALQRGILNNPIRKSWFPRTENSIIESISGGDKTKGSCSSVAFAYIGNKAGYKVRDFRGGESCDLFATNGAIIDIANLNGVKSHIVEHKDDFVGVRELIKQMDDDKEYYLATGRHAAMIRRVSGRYEYLELQSPFGDNRYKPLSDRVLKDRFNCQHSHTLYGRKIELPNILIEAESLGKNEEFQKILGYINTDSSEQIKGDGGSVK